MADLEALDNQILVLAAGHTDIGRRPHNEDAVLVRPDLDVYALADGAGGENAGNVASALALTTVAHHFEDSEEAAKHAAVFDELGLPNAARRLATAIHRANHEVVEVAKTSKRHRGMGTTVVALHFTNDGNVVHVAHVGDSRCYRLRGGELELLTSDHSLANDVLELRPDLPAPEAAKLPRNVITRALGMSASVRVSVRSFHVLPGDCYVLCSDGLSDVLDEAQIVEALDLVKVPEELARLLVDLAKSAGADDNVAAVAIVCKSPPGVGSSRVRAPLRVRPSPARHPDAASTSDESSPEIVIVGPDGGRPSMPGSGGVAVVPPQSSSANLVSAMQGFLGPMRPARKRAPKKKSAETQLCASCGASMPSDAGQCPSCGSAI